jgi:hypothetical protein
MHSMAAPKNNRHSSKYNAERHQKIIELILSGNTRTTSFAAAGVHPDSAFLWLKYARERPDDYPEYVELLQDIEHAEALVESEKVAQVKLAADNGTWQAAAWWLERRKPKDWGRNDQIRHTGEIEGPKQQINVLILENPDARAASRELLRGLAAGRAAIPERVGSLREPAEDAEE